MNIDTNVLFLFNITNGGKGLISESPIKALDIYPTLAELYGLEIPSHLDGQSIVPLFDEPTLQMDRIIYIQCPIARQDSDRTILGYSVKSSRFNYVEWIKMNSGETVARELYDHKLDPLRRKNVLENISCDDVKFLAHKLPERIQETDHDHEFKKIN